MAVIVRPGGLDDVDAAIDVYVRGGSERRGRPKDERIEQVRAMLRAPDTWTFIARDADEAIGMAALRPYRENMGAGELVPHVCYLDLIFVVPERWGEHVGSMLLDTVIADSRGRGFVRITLLTHDDNERAHALYASRGFERTGQSRLASDPTAGVVSEWARDL